MNKKLMMVAVVLGLACGAVFADTTNTTTNAIGQIITTISDSQGVRSTSITYPSQPSSASQTKLNLPGIQLAPLLPDFTTNTLYTPRGIGDILIGRIGIASFTGTVWMATGVTTNDWKQLNQP